ncbi:MAG: hypothetical protein WBD09_04540 [Halobacteriota archaeon]
MEKIPGWVEKIFTPKVNELIGEVKALNTKVDSLRNETKSELASLRNEIPEPLLTFPYRPTLINNIFIYPFNLA